MRLLQGDSYEEEDKKNKWLAAAMALKKCDKDGIVEIFACLSLGITDLRSKIFEFQTALR